MHELRLHLSGQHVHPGEAVDLVPEEFHPHRVLAGVRGNDLHGIALHAEGAAVKIDLVPLVLHVDQLADQRVPVLLHARPKRHHHVHEVVRRADAVDAGHRGYDDHVLPLRERRQGRQPQPVDLVVDRRILRDVGVRGGHIGLRLEIVIVADEVLHRIFRKELPEFAVELGRQRLVVSDHQRGLVELLDDVRHGKGLAGTRHAQERLGLVPLAEAGDQLPDRLRLVTGGLIFRVQDKMIHPYSPLIGKKAVSPFRRQP